MHASSQDVTGCTCLDGWFGLMCDLCEEGTQVTLAEGTGICNNNTYICANGRSGDNCNICDGLLCSGTIMEKIKAVIDSEVQNEPSRVSRSKAWGKPRSLGVIRQRKKDLMSQLLVEETDPVLVSNTNRDQYDVCQLSIRSDCATTKKNLKLVTVKSFSGKSRRKCDVYISDFTIVFGLVTNGDQMTVCDADNNILFHQKMVNEDVSSSPEYEISMFNGKFFDFPQIMSEHDTFYKAGISFTIANLEAVADPCIENDCSFDEQCVVNGDEFDCILPCSTNPCDHGTCENTGGGGFSCDCTGTGYEGTTCSTPVDICNNHDCQHGSECVDEVGSFSCNCTGTGYDGDKCENNVDDCSPDSCTNGICVDVVNSFTCDCYAGHEGPECDDIIDCVDCMNGGNCIEGNQTFTCQCADGWENDIDTGLCTVDKNECDPNPCQNNGGCTDGVNSFSCNCDGTGYTKDSSGLCTVLKDPCANINCVPGSCSEGECDCSNTGFEVNTTTGLCTVNINYCETNSCVNGYCMDGQYDYTCDCYPGWDKDELGHCTENPDECPQDCGTHGDCVNGNGTHVCDCRDGFTTAPDGHSCQCGVGKGFNITSGKCEPCAFPDYNLEPTGETACVDFLCPTGQGVIATGWNASEETHCETCPNGYSSPLGNTACEDNNECLQNPCGNHGSCSNTDGSYVCVCDENYAGDNCDGINHCKDVNCNNGECHNEETRARCICEQGWEGELCTDSVNDCPENACYGHGVCNDKHNYFNCTCNSGFSGEFCQTNIDDCDGHDCAPGTCEDGINDYTCNCAGTGYIGTRCNEECTSSNCIHGNCTGQGCECERGYEGPYCNVDTDECASNPCKNGASCTHGIGTFECACVAPFEGTTCNECPPGYGWDGLTCSECPVGTTNDLSTLSPCVNHTCPNGYGVDLTNWSPDHREEGLCIKCEQGYESPEGHGVCENIDECSTLTYPCSGHGQCEDTEGGYKCTCNGGYSGDTCDVSDNNCLGDPCGGGECIDLENCYRCDCTEGLSGTTFCVDIDECTPSGETIEVRVNGTKYYINGETAPPLTLKIGETYTFSFPNNDYNDHPIRIYSGSDLESASSGDTVVFTPEEGKQYRYDCLKHPGMGNDITLVPFLCHNDANCVNLYGDYECECPENYVGKNCDIHIVDFCASASVVDYIEYNCCELPTC